MAYSYKGSISFGLVYIPITLHSVIKNNDISFNLLDKKTLSRVKYKKTCVNCNNRELKSSDIVKGYEYEKDKYVVLDEAELNKIKTQKDKNITIESFVNLNEIDPLYFDRPFYVVPTSAERPFALLLEALEKEKKCAIAKTVLGSKETLIAIRAKNGKMLLNTLFFYDEVQKIPKEINFTKDAKFEKELKIATTLINNMTEKFKPENYTDEYRVKLKKALDKKIAGQKITKSKEKSQPKITSLMEALKKSLDMKKFSDEPKPIAKKKAPKKASANKTAKSSASARTLR